MGKDFRLDCRDLWLFCWLELHITQREFLSLMETMEANYSSSSVYFYILKFFFQLNFKNKQKTEDSNKVFNSVQESIKETTKPTKKKPISKVKKTSNVFLIVRETV